jgi:hypothetical protein
MGEWLKPAVLKTFFDHFSHSCKRKKINHNLLPANSLQPFFDLI